MTTWSLLKHVTLWVQMQTMKIWFFLIIWYKWFWLLTDTFNLTAWTTQKQLQPAFCTASGRASGGSAQKSAQKVMHITPKLTHHVDKAILVSSVLLEKNWKSPETTSVWAYTTFCCLVSKTLIRCKRKKTLALWNAATAWWIIAADVPTGSID